MVDKPGDEIIRRGKRVSAPNVCEKISKLGSLVQAVWLLVSEAPRQINHLLNGHLALYGPI